VRASKPGSDEGQDTVPRDGVLVISVTVWALPRPTLVRVGIAHVQSSIYVAQPTSGSQFSAVPPLSHPLVAPLQL
jgi:hypothetical protein